MKDSCRGCGAQEVRPFFDLGELPLAGGFLSEDQIPDERRYPLLISVCDACSLVQIVHPVDPEILFQATAATRVLHCVASIIVSP